MCKELHKALKHLAVMLLLYDISLATTVSHSAVSNGNRSTWGEIWYQSCDGHVTVANCISLSQAMNHLDSLYLINHVTDLSTPDVSGWLKYHFHKRLCRKLVSFPDPRYGNLLPSYWESCCGSGNETSKKCVEIFPKLYYKLYYTQFVKIGRLLCANFPCLLSQT